MIDLDAAKAARREARKEAPQLTYNGEVYTLPVELPFTTGQALLTFLEDVEGGSAAVFEDVVQVIRPLFGDRFDEFMEAGPSLDDLIVLMGSIPGEYGFQNLGESPASEGSSPNASRPSKPTSVVAMAST